MRVMRKHREALKELDPAYVPLDLLQAARASWDEAIERGEQAGLRNSQISVLAPTGTIAFMMDCDTTGVEPDIALVKYKKLVGGGVIKIVNKTVPLALRRLGYDKDQVQRIVEHIDEQDTIEGADDLQDEHLPVFDCAFRPANGSRSIHYRGHLKMLGATQPFISGAISKTINMPETSTVEDIADAYLEGWKLGLKAIAIYRDGCKRSQPLSTRREDAQDDARGRSRGRGRSAGAGGAGRPSHQAARRAPRDHAQVLGQRPRGLRHGRPLRQRPAGRDLPHHGEAGLDGVGPGRRLRDRHLDRAPVRRAAAHAGRQVLAHALRAVGLHHQQRDPDREVDHRLHLPLAGVEVPVDRRAARRGRDPARPTAGGGDPRAERSRAGAADGPGRGARRSPPRTRKITFHNSQDAPSCHACGSIMVRNGSCYKCLECGETSGCS